MDIADLKVFEAVARLGGMNRAAIALNTVQSNITARIKALEADIGCLLFERRPRGVALTAGGQRLLPYAERAMRLIADARCAARDDGSPRGLLTIGSLETTAALRLTPLLAGYAAHYPDVDLVLRTGTTRELVAATLEQSVDGAFVCGPVGRPELEEEVVFREELSLVAAPGVSSLAEVLGSGTGEVQAVVLRAGCSYRQRLETLLAQRGITVRRHLEFGTLEAIFGCVAAGLGITLLPRALL
jgi:DNA-binding transcriptional LysR family regulator